MKYWTHIISRVPIPGDPISLYMDRYTVRYINIYSERPKRDAVENFSLLVVPVNNIPLKMFSKLGNDDFWVQKFFEKKNVQKVTHFHEFSRTKMRHFLVPHCIYINKICNFRIFGKGFKSYQKIFIRTEKVISSSCMHFC